MTMCATQCLCLINADAGLWECQVGWRSISSVHRVGRHAHGLANHLWIIHHVRHLRVSFHHLQSAKTVKVCKKLL